MSGYSGKSRRDHYEGDIRMGRVNFGGVVKHVCLDYVPEVAVGDYAIVHVGFAISKIDEQTALETLDCSARWACSRRNWPAKKRPLRARPSSAVAVSGRKLRPDRARPAEATAREGGKMKYLTEFRNGEIAQRMAREIHQVATRPWKIMEVCGGQTHSIIRNGIDQMLPAGIEMIHGPGCPVCVTPLELIDKALAIAAQPGVIFCSFGDMLRVPGTDARPVPGQGPGRRCARRLLAAGCRGAGRARIPTSRWFSSAWDLRPPPRPTR